jgi:hypothetical protein
MPQRPDRTGSPSSRTRRCWDLQIAYILTIYGSLDPAHILLQVLSRPPFFSLLFSLALTPVVSGLFLPLPTTHYIQQHLDTKIKCRKALSGTAGERCRRQQMAYRHLPSRQRSRPSHLQLFPCLSYRSPAATPTQHRTHSFYRHHLFCPPRPKTCKCAYGHRAPSASRQAAASVDGGSRSATRAGRAETVSSGIRSRRASTSRTSRTTMLPLSSCALHEASYS